MGKGDRHRAEHMTVPVISPNDTRRTGDMYTARCRFQLTAGTAVLVAMLLLAACNWPQFRYGPDHIGFNASENTIGPTNVSGLRLRWSQSVGSVLRPTAVANGTLYDDRERHALPDRRRAPRWRRAGPADRRRDMTRVSVAATWPHDVAAPCGHRDLRVPRARLRVALPAAPTGRRVRRRVRGHRPRSLRARPLPAGPGPPPDRRPRQEST